jgi:chromate reductase
LGIAGSLRESSYNRALLRAAETLVGDAATLKIYEGLGAIPPFNEDAEDDPGLAVTDLRRRIEEADAVLIATPEYNHSIPGVLKNAVDWASRPYGESSLASKPMAVVGASPGRSGAAEAQADLRRVLRSIGAEVVDAVLELDRVHRGFDDAGRLVDDEARATLGEIVERLVRAAGEAGSPGAGPA